MPGFGAPWAFYPLAAVLSGIALSVILGSLLPARLFVTIIWAEISWWAFLALLWYFVVGRIPDHIRVRIIRKAFPPGTLVYAARSDRSAERWIAETLRDNFGPRPRQFGLALVATTTELQLWMGSANDSIPVAAVGWSDVVSVKPSAERAGRIRILLAPDDLSVDFRVANPRWIAPVIARGRVRARVIDELERRRLRFR